MFVYELVKLHHLEKQAINVVVRYSEPERRKIFGKKIAARTSLWLALIVSALILVQVLIQPVTCGID